MIPLYVLIFIVSCVFLSLAGKWVVESLIKITRFLKVREFIVASILMAFSTSLPELFIGITSALNQAPQLSFGDIIGSNIIILTLIVGIVAFVGKGLRFEGKTLQTSSLYASLIALIPLLLILDGKASRADGLILLLALGLYFHQLLYEEEKFRKIFDKFKEENDEFKSFLKNLGIFIGGICILLASAQGIVFSTSYLAKGFNLPLVIIGVLLVAIGTSLPEITFGVRSIIMGRKEMILGDLMGSVVINSTLIFGLVSLISPVEIPNFSPYFIGIIFTVVATLFFTIFARTHEIISRKEAVFLILIYIVFVIIEIVTQF
mgnify:CR=1 FL=1